MLAVFLLHTFTKFMFNFLGKEFIHLSFSLSETKCYEMQFDQLKADGSYIKMIENDEKMIHNQTLHMKKKQCVKQIAIKLNFF